MITEMQIRTWMRQNKITQKQIADLAGTYPGAVVAWIRGDFRNEKIGLVFKESGMPPDLIETNKSISKQYLGRYIAGERISEIAASENKSVSDIAAEIRYAGLKHKLSDKYRPDKAGDTIKKWMRRNGITGASVARQTGLSPVTVSAWLNGRTRNKKIEQVFVQSGLPPTLLKNRKMQKRLQKRTSPYSDSELAELAGVSLSAVRKWKAGILTSAKIDQAAQCK